MVSDLSAEHVPIAGARSSTPFDTREGRNGPSPVAFRAPACQPFIHPADPAIVDAPARPLVAST
ncbi:MAG TPA: hypothetical protein VLD67_06820 [Vicinamibacterales bacterium]|nr:hypothetical protein [Vicinamibacterales bacterium]